MLALGGVVFVLQAVFGHILERGNPYVLIQSAEILIVVGAAMGITLVSNRAAMICKV
jgi:flagellar motor component MotA